MGGQACECPLVCAGSQRVLSTSRDDTLRVWDAKQDLNQLASMKHYNNTGRWVVPFRGVWGPASDTVVVGSMKRTVSLDSFMRHAHVLLLSAFMNCCASWCCELRLLCDRSRLRIAFPCGAAGHLF